MEQTKMVQLKELKNIRKELIDQKKADEQKLAELKTKEKSIYADRNSALSAYISEQKTLLSEEGKRLLEEREKCEKAKHSFLKWLLTFGACFGLFIYFKAQIQSALSFNNFLFFVIASIISIVVGILITEILNIPQKRKIEALSKQTPLEEYDTKIKNFELNGHIEDGKLRNDIKKDEEALKSHISKCEAEIKEIENKIFSTGNPNTIFIATLAKCDIYEIYVDGLIYKRHKGQEFFPIKVEKGLHSVRVVAITETSESRITYELGTLQFDIQDNAVFCTAYGNFESLPATEFIEICSKEIKGFSENLKQLTAE